MRPAPPSPSPPPPLLKWAGGKRWLLPHLLPLWQSYGGARLVEPFCGGLAIALGLAPQAACLADANPHLVNFYRWVQAGLRAPVPFYNDEAYYYACRRRFNDLIQAGLDTGAEAAALFYYLNRTGYNGLCRFNRSGLFNVPFGRYKRIRYITDFSPYQPLLAPWRFLAADFDSLKPAPSDFIYADPPYDVPFTQYSARPFGWPQQVHLAEWLAAHPGPVVLSNQATDRILALYRALGYSLTFHQAPRRIACTGDRTPAWEVLATHNI